MVTELGGGEGEEGGGEREAAVHRKPGSREREASAPDDSEVACLAHS